VSGREASERVSEMNYGVSTGAEARASWRPGALQRARHRGGEVAAAGLGQDGVARGGSSSARGGGSRSLWSDAWAPARSRRWLGGGPERRAGGAVKQRSRQEEGEKGLLCNIRKFQGPKCKTAITFKLKLK